MKLAAKVARRLEDRILSEGWPIGQQIGRESELATEMGVSRWTLREAMRILEVSGLVETRKGVRGGSFVASSAQAFVSTMIANYLQFIHVPASEFSGVQSVISRLVWETAVARLSPEDRKVVAALLAGLGTVNLSKQLEVVEKIIHVLVRVTDNPALVLFTGAISRMGSEATLYSDLDDDSWYDVFRFLISAISDIAEALLDSNLTRALAANDRYILGCRQIFEGSLLYQGKQISSEATRRAYSFFPPARPLKKVDMVERQIRELIFDEGWRVGAMLGLEAELVDRFQVGRSVLREALRSLEQLGVIEMGRGSNSGLRVVSPDPVIVTEACRRYLRREGTTPGQAGAVREALAGFAGGEQPNAQMRALFLRILSDEETP